MTEENTPEKSPIAQKEEETLAFWESEQIFKKTLEKESPEGEFVFYEGPPTANGRPGIHHLISRSFKDVIPRYKTMRGFHVRRKAGWDTHGLPVELEVEKQLGFTNKKEIEEYGIAAFNDKCKESVWKYVDEWKRFTNRIGYWVDLDDAYITYYPQFIESVWNVVKTISDRKLLYRDYKVLPWCSRCGTALSSHEVAQGYTDVKDLSVYVKFKVKGEENTYLLAWTTTPWTLPGNVALAVGEDVEYVYVSKEGETLILAKERMSVLGEGYEVAKEVKGKDLLGFEYEPLYPYLSELVSDEQKENLKNAFKVYPADFVTTTDGTGIVHTAVMYGQEDFELGTKVGLPKHHLVDETGHFIKGMGDLSGLPVKDREDNGLATAIHILKYLQEKGNFFHKEQHEHTYPYCWRCKTPLIYYARDSWYVRMSELRNDLVKENEKINWVPEHIKEGRFGEWLREIKDWAISRDRYWGTPLPIWECLECEHREVVGSIEQLLDRQKKSGNRYIVMRHGESISNEKNVMSTEPGDAEDKLTDKGRQEAAEAGKKLAGEKIDMIVSSNFTRTKETTDIVAHELGITDVIVDEALHEINLGVYDGKTVYEAGLFFLGDGWYDKRPEGGESHADVRLRVAKFIFDLDKQYQNKTILIVTHGAPGQMLSAVAAHATQETLGEHLKLFKNTTEYHELKFTPYPHDTNFDLDLHKPFIDDVVLDCPKCHNDMRRTPEVMDVWFDSGSMPFAQDHYPFENEKWIEGAGYPADYISEAIDQTRGWFYTLHAVGVLMGRGHAYKNVICLGHILDAKGKKMSKSIGNVINPWEMMDKYGVDVLRFWMFSVNQPGDSKNFDEKTVVEVNNKVFALLRNMVKFFRLYETEGNKATRQQLGESKNVLDVWILALLNKLIADVTGGLDAYDTFGPTRAIRDFMNDFSTWYVRRSRDRFKGDDTEDAAYALATLRHVTIEVAKVMAPFTPFFAEEVYKDMGGEKESVHLEEFPRIQGYEDTILKDMEIVRSTVSLALEARMKAGVKIRQPLASLKIRGNKDTRIQKNPELIALIKDELNVKEVVFDESAGWEVELDTNITPELKREGDIRELSRAIQDFRKTSGLTPSDKIALVVTTDAEGKALIEAAREELMKATGLTSIDVVEGGVGFVFSLQATS
ncbi:MAG: isoleucyl-tRNA synthetase [Patescibacteria group bacterium]|nr:isoleucyl-tRNA synthetase [Patescibacteria group bacterium]